MNNCTKYIEQMNMYLDGELKGSKISELLEHIERCPNCKKRFESLKIISFQTREMEIKAPADLHEKIMRNMRANIKPQSKQKPVRWMANLAAVAAVFIFLVAGVTGGFTPDFLFNGRDEAAPTTAAPAGNNSRIAVASAGGYEAANDINAEAVSDGEKSAILDTAKQSPLVAGEKAADADEFAFLKLFSGKGELPDFVSEYTSMQDPDSLLYYVYVENQAEVYSDFENRLEKAGLVDGGELKNASNINKDAAYVLYIINLD